jgi:hypothetical protein
MDFVQAREMVRLRHELRHLMVERRLDEARVVLVQLEALATLDAEEADIIRPEIARWRSSMDLGLGFSLGPVRVPV